MTRLFALSLTATLALSGAALAESAAPLKLALSQKLNATPAEVWAAIGRFDDMSWHPAVQRTEMTTPDATTSDKSTRVLHLRADAGDPTITERLTAADPGKRCYSYVIAEVDPKVVPVTDYASTLCVADDGGKARVDWSGGFRRADQGDEAASKAVAGIYQGGLDALAQRFGKAD